MLSKLYERERFIFNDDLDEFADDENDAIDEVDEDEEYDEDEEEDGSVFRRSLFREYKRTRYNSV